MGKPNDLAEADMGKKVAKKAGVTQRAANRASVERIKTLHPEGKAGVNIEKAKYDEMRRALLKVIPKRQTGVAFKELGGLVEAHLDEEVFPTPTKVLWYVTTVKQDLEARGEIEQVAGAKPQHLRRI